MYQSNSRITIRHTGKRRLQAGNPQLGVFLILTGLIALALLAWEGAGQGVARHLPAASYLPKLDKLLHFGAHAIVTFCLFWGSVLAARPPLHTHKVRGIALFVLLLDFAAGFLIEAIQLEFGQSAGRVFDWKDIIANSAGAATAVVISILILNLLRRPKSRIG